MNIHDAIAQGLVTNRKFPDVHNTTTIFVYENMYLLTHITNMHVEEPYIPDDRELRCMALLDAAASGEDDLTKLCGRGARYKAAHDLYIAYELNSFEGTGT